MNEQTPTAAIDVVYRGIKNRACGGQLVTRTEDGKTEVLKPELSLKVWNHSPTGFSWGYGGSGPAQLALALLLDASEDEKLASFFHQAFKWEFVAKWGEEWSIRKVENPHLAGNAQASP